MYTSNEISYEEIPYPELYSIIIDYFQNYCITFGYDHDAESRMISYKNTKIKYSLYHSSQNKKYFLNFIPENVWQWSTKNVLLPAMTNLVSFYDSLPVSIEFEPVIFTKTEITGALDISKWTFSTVPDLGYNRVEQIQNLITIRKLGVGISNYYKVIEQLNINYLID